MPRLTWSMHQVLRGGSWEYSQYHARAAFRYGSDASYHGSDIGFRVVLGAAPVP